MEFPGMTFNELSPGVGGEEAGVELIPVKNLDQFFKELYEYYYEKGFGVMALSEACSILSLGFTVLFTSFLIGIVNWPVLNECFDESTCQNVESELFLNPFHQEPSFGQFMITIYLLLFLSYWFYSIHRSVKKISRAWEMEEFYREHLKIPFHSITDFQWSEVLDRFILLYEQDNLPFLLFPSQKETDLLLNHQTSTSPNPSDNPLHPLLAQPGSLSPPRQLQTKPKLNIQHIIYRIMRKENYFIALINKHQLNLFLPWWLSPYTTEQLILTKTIEWSLYFCLFDEMFYPAIDGTYLIAPSFFQDISGLQYRFQMIGILAFLLIPFLLVFMCFHFFLENATNFHSTKAYLGPRQWTPLALWSFREFNELKHLFEQRMNQAYLPATEYLLSFQNHSLIVLAKLISYISGGIVATILLISLFHSEAILHITLWEHNLLWYLGVASACFATSRSILPDETKKSEAPASLLSKMMVYTHQDGLAWLGSEHTTKVRNEVNTFLMFKIQLFLAEMTGVLLTPFILCFSLPRCVPTLLEFLRVHSEYVENVGMVCDYSLFNIEKHGDPEYGSVTDLPTTTATGPEGRIAKDVRLNGGKLEKSVMNFAQHYPTADLGPATNNFLGRVDLYRSMRKNQHEREIATLLEKSLFPGVVDDRVILPAGRSNSGEDDRSGGLSAEQEAPSIAHPKGAGGVMERGTSEDHDHEEVKSPDLPFPLEVGGESRERVHQIYPDTSGNSSPARTVVTSDYYPFHNEDMTTLNNTLANRGGYHPSHRPQPSLHHEPVAAARGGGGGTTILKSPNYSQQLRYHQNNSSRANTPRRLPSSSSFILGNRLRGSTSSVATLTSRPSGARFPQYSEHSHPLQGLEEEDMPSVLLSLLKQRNIDYENDFYWLEKFHRDKILSKRGGGGGDFLEKSMQDFQLHQQQQQSSLLHRSNRPSVNVSSSSSSFPFAIPQQMTRHYPPTHHHSIPIPVISRQSSETARPPAISPPLDSVTEEPPPAPILGLYATNINRNVVASPKPQFRGGLKKSFDHHHHNNHNNNTNNDSTVSENSGDAVTGQRKSDPNMILTSKTSEVGAEGMETPVEGVRREGEGEGGATGRSGGYFPFNTSSTSAVNLEERSDLTSGSASGLQKHHPFFSTGESK